MRWFRTAIAALAAAAAAPHMAAAHIGSPDVFLDGQAGVYRLFVTIRPPRVIPGVADVEIFTNDLDVRDVRIVPLPLTGPGAQFAPASDLASRSTGEPRLFVGHPWMMTAGAWQVRVILTGDRGQGTLSVPVPTLPQATLAMTRSRRVMLFAFMLVLSVGFVSIVSAIAREARLDTGETPDPPARRRGRIAGAVAACVVAGAILLGNWWWNVEASSYARYVYKPLQATPTMTSDGRLTLHLIDPGWIASRRLDDFVTDHGHLMHLFVVSPALDRLWHLHPDETAAGAFEQWLPEVPEGRYELFADLVHRTGVSETVTGHIETRAIHGAALQGDDSGWSEMGSPVEPGVSLTGEGGRIVWVPEGQPLRPKRLTLFTFRVEDASGQPAGDLELYMGMPGHAIFIRRDRRVFAHVHPSGSASMAAMEMAMASTRSHAHHGTALPPTVTFPYGFPEAGDYRIFVQVKRSGRVQTGVFDAHVD
jgi:hypothetical protein